MLGVQILSTTRSSQTATSFNRFSVTQMCVVSGQKSTHEGPDKGCEAPRVSWGEYHPQLQSKAESFIVRLVLGQSMGLPCLQASVRVMTMLKIMTVGDRKGFYSRKVKQFPQSHIVSDRVEIFNPDTSSGI